MKFKIDDNLPLDAAELLRLAGYDATTVIEEYLGGEKDVRIAAVCQQEKRALITLDNDFADIRTYPPQEYSGLIVLRLKEQSKRHILKNIKRLLPVIAIEPVEQFLWLVEEEKIRIRG